MKHSKPQASPLSAEPPAQQSEIPPQPQEIVGSQEIANNASRIAQRVERWVGNQPELTRILCDYVVQYAPQVTDENPEKIVDLIVQKEISSGWENSLAAGHLDEIEQVIVQDARKDSALILYIQILQRGKVPINSNNLEQAVLLKSGLVKVNSGYLKVANALYKQAFDLKKVEQMLPGITKPVKIIPSVDKTDHRSAKTTAFYSKAALVACGLAIMVTSISSYIRESGGRAMATSSDRENDTPALEEDTFVNLSDLAPNVTSRPTEEAEVTARELFDRGEGHAINSRWVSMIRDFCTIPEASMYYSPAKQQVTQLFKLHSTDIQHAREVVQAEKDTACPM